MSQPTTRIEAGAAIRGGSLVLRLLWIALRLFAVLCVGRFGAHFFYQGF